MLCDMLLSAFLLLSPDTTVGHVHSHLREGGGAGVAATLPAWAESLWPHSQEGFVSKMETLRRNMTLTLYIYCQQLSNGCSSVLAVSLRFGLPSKPFLKKVCTTHFEIDK